LPRRASPTARQVAVQVFAVPPLCDARTIRRMRIALSEMVVEGIQTNIPLHQDLLNDKGFVKGGPSIHYLEQKLAQEAKKVVK
jgi:biotin carboxylase